MKRASFVVQPLRIAAVLTLSACIGTDCVTLPCLLPRSVTVTVSSAASGGTVASAVVQISSTLTGTTPCSGTPTTCQLSYPGTYTVTVSAPGFQSATRNVNVAGAARQDDCHCPASEVEQVSVGLVAN